MHKLLISLVFLTLPALAQVSSLMPVKPLNIGDMTAPPAVSAFAAGTRELERTSTPGRTLYRWSLASVLAANAVDAATSWNSLEANRVVAGSGTQFGGASIAIKSGLVATSLVIQHVALRHRPDLYKNLAWMNFVTSGILGGVASHNAQLR